ncbi:MAG: hypothetical protein QOI28_809 [Mycobacterium sp.]|jgi:hypothetical protein|nr:hypothetical protein [Mycobacterium sp.]
MVTNCARGGPLTNQSNYRRIRPVTDTGTIAQRSTVAANNTSRPIPRR